MSMQALGENSAAMIDSRTRMRRCLFACDSFPSRRSVREPRWEGIPVDGEERDATNGGVPSTPNGASRIASLVRPDGTTSVH